MRKMCVETESPTSGGSAICGQRMGAFNGLRLPKELRSPSATKGTRTVIVVNHAKPGTSMQRLLKNLNKLLRSLSQLPSTR